VSIAVGSVSLNGTRLDIQISVHNSGVTEFTSMEIGEIALRVLRGAASSPRGARGSRSHWQAYSRYIQHRRVDPGRAAECKKAAVTESGTVERIGSSPYKFSLGEVIFPQ